MNIDQWIGTKPVRIAAIVFAVISVSAFAVGGSVKFIGVVFALLAFMGLIASFHAVYQRWMKFASVLQKIVVTILFGVCYMIVVPFFWLLLRGNDPLKLRPAADSTASLWRTRKAEDTSADSYLRMG